MKRPFYAKVMGLLVVIIALMILSGPQALAEPHQEERSQGGQIIISDDRFMVGSEGPLDVQAFLRERSAVLSTLQVGGCDGQPWTLAEQLEYFGHLYGIDPRVLLTLLELKSGLLSNPEPDDETLQWAMGHRDAQYAGLSNQIEWAEEELTDAFYASYYGEPDLQIVFNDGTHRPVSPGMNAGTYAIQRFLARDTTEVEWGKLVGRGTGSFYEVYLRFFGEPIGARITAVSPEGFPTQMELRLPWRMGEEWYFWAGPHKTNVQDSAWAAVDWGPENISCSPWDNRTSGNPVLAARGGTVVYADCNLVRVDHGSSWSTGYFHLDNIQVHASQSVSTGTILGYPSCLAGGSCYSGGNADKPHVHFDIRYNNVRQSIDGTAISGWRINAGSSERAGTMTRGSQTVSRWGKVPSDNSSDTDDGRTISAGQTLNGQVSPTADRDLYYFDGSAGQEITIEMTKSSGTVDPYLELYRPNGQYLAYNDDGAGYPNARLIQRLPENGRYQIIARSYGSYTGGYTIRVTAGSGGQDTDDGRWLVQNQTLSGTISPSNDEDPYYFSGIQGRTVSIRMEKSGSSLDSYLELYGPNGSQITYNDDGGGSLNSWLVATLPSSGTYRVKARSYAHTSSGAYTIRLQMVDPGNYALNRPAWASSQENASYPPFRAFDGRLDTRWSSQFSNQQWIYVDLGQNRTFDTVVLRWETAYGKRYGIQVWTGSAWSWVWWTNDGRGGTVRIPLGMRTARYVAMAGWERGTPWGYSLWEFEVYNSTLATIPIVPPEDPGKDPDGIEPLAPLPLPEEEEAKEVEALYLGNGENSQEVLALAGGDQGPILEDAVGQEGLPVASIMAIDPANDRPILPRDTVEFYGSAADNDADGDPGIVAYEWRSDRDGLLSTQQDFAMSGGDLSLGEHVISFRAQDNEGSWSGWDQTAILRQAVWYMPLMARGY